MRVTVDTSGLKPLVDRLQAASKNFPRDARRALVSTQRATKTQATKAVLTEYTVKRKDLKDRLTVSNVDSKSLSFEVVGRKRPIPLTAYDHLATPMFGVSVKVQRSEGSKRLPGAFKRKVSRFNAEGQTARIFVRAQVGGKRAGRLPIKSLFGPSAADMLANQAIQKTVIDAAQSKLSAEITRLIGVALGG